jgi:hypothetical protein
MIEYNSEALDFPGADRLQTAAEVAPPRQAVVDAALEAVRAAAANSETASGTVGDAVRTLTPRTPRTYRNLRTSRTSRPRHGTRRVLISAAVVAAVAAGVAVYPSVGIGSSPPAAQADAAGFLDRMADSAGAGPASDAPYWKVTTRTSLYRRTGPDVPPSTETEWLSRNHFLLTFGGGGIVELSGLADGPEMAAGINTQGTAFYTPAAGHSQQTAWRIGGTGPSPVSGKTITWDELKTLPTEPKALRARLLGDATGPEAERELFNGINGLLGNAPSGPRLRAALYRVLSDSPNLHLVGHVKDDAGRTGTAVDLKGEGWSSRMIIDPRTSQLLEVGSVTPGDDATPDTTYRITYLSAGPTDNAPRPVPGHSTPAVHASPGPKD